MFKIAAFFIIEFCICSATCEDWYFTHMWRALAWPHHFTQRGGLGRKRILTPPLFIEVPSPNQESGVIYVCVRVSTCVFRSHNFMTWFMVLNATFNNISVISRRQNVIIIWRGTDSTMEKRKGTNNKTMICKK